MWMHRREDEVIFKTEHETYEIDYVRYRVRRITGSNPPTPRFTPDGEWKQYIEVRPTLGGALFFQWEDRKGTVTTKVVDYECP
jgi:hypothetical protein